MTNRLDKDKFLTILRNEGLSAAITALHKEKNELELDTFEGPEGYQPALFELVREYCDFSRELWDTALTAPAKGSASS
jgi:hypothetical protein